MYDTSVYELAKSFYEGEQWFVELPGELQKHILGKAADSVQTLIEDNIEHERPQFRKYERPDDVGLAGWYEG